MTKRSRPSSNGRHHDPSAQSIYGGRMDHVAANQLREMVERFREHLTRQQLNNQRQDRGPVYNLQNLVGNAAFLSGGGERGPVRGQHDVRRDLNDEAGYPRDNSEITIDLLRYLYDRNPIAARVVEILPRESWQVQPWVYESEDPEELTPFERSLLGLNQQLRGRSWYGSEEGSPLWATLLDADIKSGIGGYGAVVLGLDDGRELREPIKGIEEKFSEPVELDLTKKGGDKDEEEEEKVEGNGKPKRLPRGSPPKGTYNLTINQELTKGRKLLFLRTADESMCRAIAFESNWTSPRYGWPTMYQVTGDPYESRWGQGASYTTHEVHWTRVVHVPSDGIGPFGTPRMRPVLNRLLDIDKVFAAGGEGFWRGAILSYFLSTHPQLGGDVNIDYDDLLDQIEQFQNGLQRFMALTGMGAQPVAPQVVDPTPHLDACIQAICIRGGYPKRVFMGSERGELASGQDDAAWNDRLRLRQNERNTPAVIAPVVDRLIMAGVLEEPGPAGWRAEWPDLDSQTAQERAAVAGAKVAAIGGYVSGGVEQVMSPIDFWTKVMGMDEEEAQEVIDNAEENQALVDEENLAMADEMGFEQQPPEGFVDPEQKQAELDALKAKGGRSFPPRQSANAENAFCATGEGGGVDPGCSSEGEGGGGGAKLPKDRRKLTIPQAGKALAAAGYRLHPPETHLHEGKFITRYKVDHPSGETKLHSSAELRDFVYKIAKKD